MEMEEEVPMQELKINVKNELKDYKEYCFARLKSNTIRDTLISMSLGFIILLFAVIRTSLKEKPYAILTFFLVYFTITLLILSLFSLGYESLMAFLKYRRIKEIYETSLLFREPECYEFNDNSFTTYSKQGNSSVLWKKFHKVVELKPCFLFYTTPAENIIFPKRFLKSQEQLQELRGFLTKKIDGKKLKLKKYPLRCSEPYDSNEFETKNLEEAVEVKNASDSTSAMEIKFSPLKSDIIGMNLRILYRKPSTLIPTFTGVFIIISDILKLGSSRLSHIQTIILGLILTLFSPIMVLVNANKYFKMNGANVKIIKYRFYKEYYIMETDSEPTRIEWSDLYKIVETRKAFLLYVTKQIVHFIPKREIQKNEKQYNKFKRMIEDKKGLKNEK